ncbi:hypothetical protein Cgig2_020370 [Carnegiea gigantea]|uniref:Uncharacterized protein n=1 Tax=Carnegiea gigantea TaxID=171969 RepID=A0A9Q1KCP4_9CARY|nr:hypothetical protein Cgig2_020370 [Carnegiea gigantea]
MDPGRHGWLRGHYNLGLLEEALTPRTRPRSHGESYPRLGGQKVNPTGMIFLPVCFGDKSKFKSLEVDFLVVDVPTAYNAIIGRPTLHRVKAVVASTMKRREHSFIENKTTQHNSLQPSPKQKAKTGMNKTGGRGLRVGLSAVSRSSSSDASGSASKVLVASSSAASPSDEGRINSTSLGGPPQQPVQARPQSARRRQNTNHLKICLQGLARPYGDRRGCPSDLADSRATWPRLHQPWPYPTGIVAPSFRSCGPLDLPTTSYSVPDRETSPSSRRHHATAFTPLAKTSAMAISSSEIFGGYEAPGAARSDDLTTSWTRESLMLTSALIKLAEGRGGFAPLMTGSPIYEQTDGRPSLLPLAKGRTPLSPQGVPRSSASCEPASSQRASSHEV